MKLLRRITWVLCLILFSARVQAQSLPLQNLTEDDFKKIVGDLSTNFMHTSVSGAGTLGHLFGFEVGVVAGTTNSPHLNEVVHKTDVNADASKVHNAEILGVLTVPFGITGEVGLLPQVGGNNFKFRTSSLAVKWTPTEVFFDDFPLDLAVKASVTKSNLKFNESVGSPATSTDFDFDSTETMLAVYASKNFVIVEPYVGAGVVSATGDMSVTGSSTVFSTSYPSGQSASVKRTGGALVVGTEVKLLFVKLGVEYMNMFNTGRLSGKLSVFF